MSDDSQFDPALGHRFFSAEYFNRVWGLLDKEERSPEEGEAMLSMCHASLAHWRDRDDCGAGQLSIGYWQLSRVYAVLGKGEPAKHYGELCLEASADQSAFYLGYAFEALARAERLLGNDQASQEQLARAREQLGRVSDEDERKLLATDLETIAAPGAP